MASTRRYFPLDVWLDILARLPVKSLKRFQCVCKSWYHHLRSPYFVTQHLHFHCKNNRLNNLFLVSFLFSNRPMTCLTLLNFNDTTDDIISLGWKNIYQEGNAKILGPCNGIYCLSIDDSPINENIKTALVNLSSREFKALPDHPPRSVPFWLRRDSYYLEKVVEFAFDPKTNDYKVVSFTSIYSFLPNIKRKVFQFQVAVYSLNSNSWREVNVPMDHTLIIPGTSQNDTYLDGNVHVLACDFNHQGDRSYFIFSFNLATHVFRKIKLPELLKNRLNTSTHTHIGAYDGSLTFMIYPMEIDDDRRVIRLYKFVDIWVMQDYHIDESWTKQFRFGPILDNGKILGSWRNGQFVMQTRHKYVLYDPRNKKIKELYKVKKGWYFRQTCIYSESLVSLRGDQGNEKNMLFDIAEDHPLFANCVSHAGVWESYLEEVKEEEVEVEEELDDDEEDEEEFE